MYRNSYQNGLLSILYSIGSKPLQTWQSEVKNGHLKRITDEDIHSLVLELMSANVSTSFISCPIKPKDTLGIKLPFLVLIVKNMKKYFSFEVQILDDKNERRRFRASNYQSATKVKPFICTMPMRLDEGWNQIQFNLADFTRRAYGTNYVETLRVSIHANCRLRRVYFADRLYSEQELPKDYKLYLPQLQKNNAAKNALDNFALVGNGKLQENSTNLPTGIKNENFDLQSGMLNDEVAQAMRLQQLQQEEEMHHQVKTENFTQQDNNDMETDLNAELNQEAVISELKQEA